MLMRTERIKVESVSFASLIQAMVQGQYRIPRFQRTFVWERSRIQKLLDSMYREYPIGTIFLWRAPNEYNHMLRTVDYLHQPPVEAGQSYTLILDGQQRLSSLYVVVRGLSIQGENYTKIVTDLANESGSDLFQYRKPDNKRWISISDLVKDDAFAVYDALSPEYRQRFQNIRQRLVSYPFSTVTVSSMDLDDAIEIFERINVQSRRLTRYDLIAASVLTDDFDLRERTRSDILEPLKASFGAIPETNIPQALALNIKDGTEHTTQMALESDDVQRVWNRTVECIKLAVDFVQANLGVKRSDFLPYSAVIPVLAYYFFYGKTNSIISNTHRDQLEKWFWRTTFAERYSGASQTRMTEDAARIRSLLDEERLFDFDSMPVTLDEKAIIQASMRNTTSAVRNGVLCLLNLRHPLHFKNKSEIVISGDYFSKFTRAERHHIFPAAFLSEAGYSNRLVHSIPNFCFIPSDLNREIADQAPSQYFAAMQELHVGTGDFEKIMATHLIPVDELSGLWQDNYRKFLDQRAHLLITEIRRLCGMTVRVSEEQRNPVIDSIETALRDKIHNTLAAGFGPEYWRQAIPSDVRDRVKERVEKILRNVPGTDRSQFQNPRILLDQCDVSDYSNMILPAPSWALFGPIFKSKQDCERMLNSFRIYRNVVKHNQVVDSLVELSGQAAIVWLSRALDLDLTDYGIG